MSRIINTNVPGKTRTQLSKSTMLAIRELMKQPQLNDETKDIVAYIVLALEEISNTIDVSVEAWEKRGYWLKADRFRMEWNWAGESSGKMRKALLENDWAEVAQIAVKVAGRLSNVKIPTRVNNKTPWVGAWNILNHKK